MITLSENVELLGAYRMPIYLFTRAFFYFVILSNVFRLSAGHSEWSVGAWLDLPCSHTPQQHPLQASRPAEIWKTHGSVPPSSSISLLMARRWMQPKWKFPYSLWRQWKLNLKEATKGKATDAHLRIGKARWWHNCCGFASNSVLCKWKRSYTDVCVFHFVFFILFAQSNGEDALLKAQWVTSQRVC